MTARHRPTDEELLAFLEGSLDAVGRDRVLGAVAGDPELAREVRRAARGLAGLTDAIPSETVAAGPVVSPPVRLQPAARPSPWWMATAVAATLALAVPSTLWLSTSLPETPEVPPVAGRPASSEPSFVLVLHGTWPDAASVVQAEAARRADEYWAWTTDLARRDVLLAAGDLAWEPGEVLGSGQRPLPVAEVAAPDFVVGMFAVRVGSYEEAEALAAECPHLRYGGSVSVRRVGQGFVTTGGFGDWSAAGP